MKVRSISRGKCSDKLTVQYRDESGKRNVWRPSVRLSRLSSNLNRGRGDSPGGSTRRGQPAYISVAVLYDVSLSIRRRC